MPGRDEHASGALGGRAAAPLGRRRAALSASSPAHASRSRPYSAAASHSPFGSRLSCSRSGGMQSSRRQGNRPSAYRRRRGACACRRLRQCQAPHRDAEPRHALRARFSPHGARHRSRRHRQMGAWPVSICAQVTTPRSGVRQTSRSAPRTARRAAAGDAGELQRRQLAACRRRGARRGGVAAKAFAATCSAASAR